MEMARRRLPGKKKKKIISSEPTDSAACNASRRREAAAFGRNDGSRREDGESVSRSTRRRDAKAPPLLNEPAGRLMARLEGGADFSECEDDVVSYELVTLQHICRHIL